jgi:hypothetical protein
MTCEVLLMNRHAVAFAADSAITVVTGFSDRGEIKLHHQTGEKKIYDLSTKPPVAAMVFDVGELAGIPWSNLFANYRSNGGGGKASVAAHAADFLSFLARSCEGSSKSTGGSFVFTLDQQRDSFGMFVNALVARFRELTIYHASAQNARSAGAIDAAMKEALDHLATEVQYESRSFRNYLVFEGETKKERKIIVQPTEQLLGFVTKHHDAYLSEALRIFFDRKPPSDSVKDSLREVLVHAISYDYIPPRAPRSGLVAAGFGQPPVFPEFIQLEVAGVFGGAVKYREIGRGKTDQKNPSFVRSFAMDNLIQTFLTGMDRRVMPITFTAIYDTVNDLYDEIEGAVGHLSEQQSGALRQIINNAAGTVATMAIQIPQIVTDEFLWPIIQTKVAAAPEKSLGDYAAKLVQLVVIENEFMDNRAVAAPIRVKTLSPEHATDWSVLS